MNDNPIMTSKDVAQYLKISLTAVYRMSQEGEIPSHKVGGRRRFRRDEIDKWFAGKLTKKIKKS